MLFSREVGMNGRRERQPASLQINGSFRFVDCG
jgi:hypothetical protein